MITEQVRSLTNKVVNKTVISGVCEIIHKRAVAGKSLKNGFGGSRDYATYKNKTTKEVFVIHTRGENKMRCDKFKLECPYSPANHRDPIIIDEELSCLDCPLEDKLPVCIHNLSDDKLCFGAIRRDEFGEGQPIYCISIKRSSEVANKVRGGD